MANPVVWFEVLGKDGDKLQRFFGELFSWKIDAANPARYGMVSAGGKSGIPGGVGESHEGRGPWVTFYVASDDLHASLARAEKLGGKVLQTPQPLPDGGAIALFADPEGHVIGLFKDVAA